jgi:Holliday junction resolvase
MTPEAKVKKRVMEICRAAGCYCVPIVTGAMGPAGTPDILACWEGDFIGIECKAGRRRPTPIQQRRIAEIRAAGGIALVADEHNLDALEAFFRPFGPEEFERLIDRLEGRS